jgi:hypothetical protein
MPADQRVDDGRSLTFDTAPLAARLEILGAPVATLEIEADKPIAMIAVRLNDVAPDGSSTRVTYGLLNVTHRDGHDEPRPLEPGRRYRVAVRLNDIAYAFPAGHAIRLAVSTSYWPTAWPAPAPVRITIHTGASTLDLPVRAPAAADGQLAPFLAPEHAPAGEETSLGKVRFRRLVKHHLATGEVVSVVERGADADGATVFRCIEDIGLEIGHQASRRYSINDADPLACRTENRHVIVLRRGAWSTRVETEAILSATADAFRYVAKLRAFEGATEVFARDWDETIPRDHL